MKDRIQKFIDYKSISPGELADILEVQRSNISHILNGRNKPGASFIEKFLHAFPHVNARWLFTGEGQMVMDSSDRGHIKQEINTVRSEPQQIYQSDKKAVKPIVPPETKIIEKVILLYSDGSFMAYDAE